MLIVSTRARGRKACFRKEVTPMDLLDVIVVILTVILTVFAVLTYIEQRNNRPKH